MDARRWMAEFRRLVRAIRKKEDLPIGEIDASGLMFSIL